MKNGSPTDLLKQCALAQLFSYALFLVPPLFCFILQLPLPLIPVFIFIPF